MSSFHLFYDSPEDIKGGIGFVIVEDKEQSIGDGGQVAFDACPGFRLH